MPIVGLGPQVITAVGTDQLGSDPQAAAGLADTALKDMRNTQFARDRCYVLRFILEVEGRSSRGHTQIRDLRELLNKLLRESIREILLVLLLAHVGEGQHGNRLFRDCPSHWRSNRNRLR